MSSNDYKCQVKKVRIAILSSNTMQNYDRNVSIAVVSDRPRQSKYLRIETEEKCLFVQEYSQLKWMPDSSVDGVISIRSSQHLIVIFYDDKNSSLKRFFVELQKELPSEAPSKSNDLILSKPDPEQLKAMINNLIQSISSGDFDVAEILAEQLAKSHVNMKFNLVNKNEPKRENIEKSKLSTDIQQSSDSILRFVVQIECLSNDPTIVSIEVRSGTKLRELKIQIEKETGIKYVDQHWFVSKRYPIPDDYIFGSSMPLITDGTQQTSLGNCIQSGEKLIMYIT